MRDAYSGRTSVQTQRTVGIALATYNGDIYLEEMLVSIENQAHKPNIIVVSDDHSDDSTLNIVENRPLEFNYLLAPNPKKGVVTNFENAIRLCSTDYVALADQDDFWHPEKLKALFASMVEAEERFGTEVPILVFSDLEIVDRNLATISPSFYSMSLKRSDVTRLSDVILDGHIPGCAMLINRALVELALPFPEVKNHDWWIQIMAAAMGKLVYVDRALIKYRQHGGNTVGLGKFGQSKLYDMFSRPFAYWRIRAKAIHARAEQVRANAQALSDRHGKDLSSINQRMLNTILTGKFVERMRVINMRRSGMRFADIALLLWIL